jgi:hypothetical protein
MPNQNARYAAIVAFGRQAGRRLDDGMCPRCGKPPGKFRDEVSVREYGITGLCQPCQDVIFRED